MKFTEAQIEAAKRNAAHIREIQASSAMPEHLKTQGYINCTICGSRNAPTATACWCCRQATR